MKRLWQMASALCIAHVVLLFAGFSLQKVPKFGSTSGEVRSAFLTGAPTKAYVGAYVATLALIVLLVTVPLLGRLFRGTGETAAWLSGVIVTTGTAYVAVTIAGAFAPTSASLYDLRHGSDPGVVTALNNVHNFTDFFTIVLLGAFTLAVGVASVASRSLPAWFAWLSLPVGLLCLAAGIPATALVNGVTVVWVVWFVVLAVAMARHAGSVADAPGSPRQEAYAVAP